MLFVYLEHWWDIYAPFKPVEMTLLKDTYVHPHFGQVIHYMRRLHHKSKQAVAQDLHWSTGYIRKIEASPDGTNRMDRDKALIPYLQIPPMLLGLDEDPFLPDTLGKDRQRVLAQVNALLSGPDTEEAMDEIEHILTTYRATRDPKFVSLNAKELEGYNQALHECQKLLFSSFPDNLSDMRKHAFAHDRSSLQRLYERRERERARQGFLLIEHWLEHTAEALLHATGLRAAQLFYVRYFLYTLVTADYLFSCEARAQLDPTQKLLYTIERVECARHLGNIMLLADALEDRVKIYLKRQEFEKVVADVTELVFCIDLLCTVLEHTEVASEHLRCIERCISETEGDVRMELRAIGAKARQIVQKASLTKPLPTEEQESCSTAL